MAGFDGNGLDAERKRWDIEELNRADEKIATTIEQRLLNRTSQYPEERHYPDQKNAQHQRKRDAQNGIHRVQKGIVVEHRIVIEAVVDLQHRSNEQDQ